VTDAVEVSGEEDAQMCVNKEWPRSLEKVEPEEGRAEDETVVREEMGGG